ncbi:hypothetical protein H9Q72_008961 [Fusarium xylarioides]|uniref:Uncharacterized protein n=1 Tax=Fusarium xylarioides TaxID=221167 RepID=A0A9P7HW18_9HYPO|nr:hypothetical protein H9Q72_008961 [Fusarium xylarioides]
MLQVKPVADLLPIDEMNARLHLIQVIRDRMVKLKPDRPLNHIQFCYLMGMSLGDLGAISVQTIYGLEKLTAYFNSILSRLARPLPAPDPGIHYAQNWINTDASSQA